MRERKMDPYEDCKIEASKGVGPFIVGMLESELLNIVPANLPKRKIGDHYSVRTGSITVWVDSTSRKVTQIGVAQGFKGKLFGAVGIGCSVKDAENYLGRFVVDEDFQLIVQGLPGICFHTNPVVNDLDPTPSQDAQIKGIYVFAAENA